MIKGEIVLINFPFTDLSASKLRPAVVLVSKDSDIMVSFISSQIQMFDTTDLKLLPTEINGLKKGSIIKTSKVATLDKSLAKGLLGCLTKKEMEELNSKLRLLLNL